VPIIPGVNDDEKNIRQTAAFVSDSLSLNRVDILPYHHIAVEKYERLKKDYGLSDEIRPPSDERMSHIAHILQNSGLQVRVGG
jgi:pyruvate formate lyase activating enzyme